MWTQQKKNALNRIAEEYKQLNRSPLVNFGITVGLFNDDDLFQWKCTILGPKDTPYKGGLFYLKIIFPDDYPTGKPEILFLSPIYHLNVKFFTGKDKPLGHICVNTLNDWNPGDSVKKILPKLLALLYKIIQIVLMILMIIQEEMNLLIIEHYLTKKLNISQKNIQHLLLNLKNFQMVGIFLTMNKY